jgi:uncharacterized membrane protein
VALQQKGYGHYASVVDHLDKYARIMGICAAFIVTAGILMMVNMHKVYGGQLWLHIKMGLVLLLILFRIFSALAYKKFKSRLNSEGMVSFDDVKRRTTLFNVLQLALIAGIIILSVCRFN